MRSGKITKAASLAAWIETHRPQQIGEVELAVIRNEIGPISDSHLRRLLRECGVPLAPMVEGVRQESFEELERTLLALANEYERAGLERRKECRRLVITAKDHARWAARDAEKRARKEEMALWMLTWLENPPLFADWVRLRRAALLSEPGG